ncbi:MAG: glycine betaine ABC transporter substrate-binding protein [Filifactor alocis]|nr:glycine betaine ABC transporter substrate-binding protein [Filifactor alocis]
MLNEVFLNLTNNYDFFGDLLLSHIQITLIAMFAAIATGLLIGIFISENRRFAGLIISVVNILYTVPSIALLGVLISFTGIGNLTAVIALTVYALLPIVRGTYTGITNIDPKIIEASEAMGSTKIQTLIRIKLPLAFPVIFSSIRNMVTMTIALAGIASFVGAGGLGVAIYRGITTNNKGLILSGSLLIAFLAIFFDIVLGLFEKKVVGAKTSRRSKLVISALIAGAMMLGLVFTSLASSDHSIKIASKPTTEGYILAEITRLLIEERTDLTVKLTHGVGGGTSNLHPATLRGDFDMYPEYTGTSWQIVLKEEGNYSNDMFEVLKEKYEQQYFLTWKGMFGFNNTYGIGVQKEIADKYAIKTYSDLARYAPELVFGAEYDFFEREDGFHALSEAYGLAFKKNIDMDNGLKYQALLDKKIDVMTVFTTDGQLSDPRITVLEDDKNFYPSYMAGMVVRIDTLSKHPELNEVLLELDDLIDEETMSSLNFEVEIEGKRPEEVAKRFLIHEGLLEER